MLHGNTVSHSCFWNLYGSLLSSGDPWPFNYSGVVTARSLHLNMKRQLPL